VRLRGASILIELHLQPQDCNSHPSARAHVDGADRFSTVPCRCAVCSWCAAPVRAEGWEVCAFNQQPIGCRDSHGRDG